MFQSWLSISSEAIKLAVDVQSVIFLRMMRLSTSSQAARDKEISLMIREKVVAGSQAQFAGAAALISGQKYETATRKVMKIYKKRIRHNKRRLSATGKSSRR